MSSDAVSNGTPASVTDNGASTPPSAPATPLSEASENLRIMMEGRIFDRFWFAPMTPSSTDAQSVIQKESIFLFYEPSLKLGSFYWCEPGTRDKYEDQTIPLALITDIFLGRQTPELKSDLAQASGSTDSCFSIVSKKTALHLRAENSSVRSAWLSGIRHVWTKPTMVTQSTPNIAAMANGANFQSLNGLSPTAKRDVFVWYESGDSKLGTLRWCDVGRKETVAGQSLQLHRISDVYLGKQASELRAPEAAAAQSQQCFSIIAKDKSIHLIAASEVVRTTWLAGIKDVFANVGKKASDATSAVKNSRDRRQPSSIERQLSLSSATAAASMAATDKSITVNVDGPVKPQLTVTTPPTPASDQIQVVSNGWTPQATSLPQPPPQSLPTLSNQIPDYDHSALASPTTAAAVATAHHYAATHIQPKTTLLSHGHQFTAFEGTKPTRAIPVFVWYDESDAKLGTLYWTPVMDSNALHINHSDNHHLIKTKSADNSIPFHRITDVFMGKQSPELRSSEAEKYEGNLCFSVVSKDRSLHLVAENESTRMEFLSNIKQIFVQSGKKVDTEKANKKAVIDGASGTKSASGIEGLRSLPELSNAYLETGHSFVSYSEDGAQSTIQLWYQNDGTHLGYLYWTSNRVKEANDSQRMAVSFISDIYMGKQTAVLESLTQEQCPDSYCFSLVSSDRSLHLQAKDGLHRTEWLSNLRDLFMLAGKRTQQQAVELMVQQAWLDNPKRALLMQGAKFTAFAKNSNTGEIERKPALVWFAPEDAKLGTLYWSFNGAREKVLDATASATQSIPMHRVTDVFMGKQTAELKSESARDIPTNRCFSVLTKDRGIHVAAENEQMRKEWLEAIKSLFLESGKKVDDDKTKKKANAASGASAINQAIVEKEIASVPVSAAVSPVSPTNSNVASDPLIEGREYLSMQPSSLSSTGGSLTYWSRPVYVFYDTNSDDSVGRLYWCDRGQRVKIDAQSLPLSKVNHVYIGKHTEEFKSSEGNRYDSKQCVSIVSEQIKGRDFHLVAKDEKSRNEFVASLRGAFARAAKPSINLNDPIAVMKMLTDGEEVTSYIGSGIIGLSSKAFVWFEPPPPSDKPSRSKLGWLYWNDQSLNKEKQEENCLAINHITDVFVGKKTPELLSVEGLFVNGDHCLSVMSKKNSCHFEFRSQQSRDAWLHGIKNAYAGGGRIVRESKQGDTPGTRITTIISAKKPDSIKISTVLLEGRAFVRYLLVDEQLRKKKVFVWLSKEEGKLGTLYWEDLVKTDQKQPMKAVKENSIAVDNIKDVYIGKQSKLFLHQDVASVPADCCLSIASKEQTLDLAAKYPKDRKEWLTAIHTVFISSGRKVIENEHSVTKITMDQPVWTPMGEGLATRYPRADGITPVQLKYGIGYFNLRSIHHLVHVQTPMGAGILLPLDPTRTDGTVPVQLPWGVSYVAKRDIIPLKSTSAPTSREITPRGSISATPAAVIPHSGSAVPAMLSKPNQSLRPPRTEFTKLEAIDLLSRGTPFSLHTDSSLKPLLIVVWLNVDESPLGTLQYNLAGDGASREDNSVPVHTITDLFLGSQRFPASHTSVGKDNNMRALTIVGRKQSWNLLSERRDAPVSEWFFALHSLIRSSGKDVISEDKTPTGQTTTHFAYSKPVEPDYSDATHNLQSGARMTQHIVDRTRGGNDSHRTQSVYVWYSVHDGELGTLYTANLATHSVPVMRAKDGAWNLQDIRDLFLGSRNFRKSLGPNSPVDNNHCLSIVLKDRSELNLEAKDKHDRDLIFHSVVSVLKNGPKVGGDEDGDEFDEDEEKHQFAPVSQQQQYQTVTVPLTQSNLQSINRTEPLPGAVVPGSFQYAGTHVSIDGGDSNYHTASTNMAAELASTGTTILALDSNWGAHNHANDAEPGVVSVTMSDSQAASVQSSPTNRNRDSLSASRESVGAATNVPGRESEGPSLVNDGVEMTVWTGDAESSHGTRQFVYWSPAEPRKRLGSLYWCDPEERTKVPGQELPLHHVSDVYLGRYSPALKAPEAQSVPSNQCFVLLSKNVTFSCQANSAAERDQWIRQFKRKFAQGGKQVIDQKKQRESLSAAQATPSQTPQSTTPMTHTLQTPATDSTQSTPVTETARIA